MSQDGSASSLIRANSGVAEAQRSNTNMGRNARRCLSDQAEPFSPLQKQQPSDISGSPHVRLLTCTICSCKSQSIPTFFSCRNAFSNTVIYPKRIGARTPASPAPRSTNCHPLLYPTNLPTQGGRNPPSKPATDGHSTYATDKNFYFFLMTLNTTATREKTMIKRHQTCFITDPDKNSKQGLH